MVRVPELGSWIPSRKTCLTPHFFFPVCPDGWAQLSGHCYKLLNQIPFAVDSEQGALDCSSVQGTLPTYSSLENYQIFLDWK